MKTKNLHLIFKIINYWLVFNVVLVFATNLPHWRIPIGSWLNYSVYFLLFLLCFYIVKRDRYNKDIYLNLSLLFVFHAVGFVSVFVGRDYSFGSNNLAYYILEYRTIIINFLLSSVGLYFTVKYLFDDKGMVFRYLLCFAVVSAAIFFNFHDYLLDKDFIINTDYSRIYLKAFQMGFLPFFALILYGYLLYKYDKPCGEYTNLVVSCFFILIVLELLDSIPGIYKVRLFSIRQYILLFNLSFFVYVLFKKLDYTYSEFGEFYEDLLFSRARLKGLVIKRRKEAYVFVLNFLRSYLSYRKNYCAFFVFLVMFFLNFFGIPLYLRLNIFVGLVCFVLIFFFFSSLYDKRMKRGNFLPH